MPSKRMQQTKRYIGRSLAYRIYVEHEFKTQALLKAGISGLGEVNLQHKKIIQRFKELKAPKGPRPKNYEVQFDLKRKKGGGFECEMDSMTAKYIRDMMKSSMQKNDELRFHLYGILLVSAWGAYETYVSELFKELFCICPELLISNETCTYEEIVKNVDSPVSMLAQKQLIKIGRFSIGELLEYLGKRVGYKPTTPTVRKLQQLYRLRNILVHSSGIIALPLQTQISKSVRVVDGNLKITKQVLLASMKMLQSSTRSIEKTVVSKFFRKPKGS